MRHILHALAVGAIASCMALSVPAFAAPPHPDKPWGDHPEKRCKPEKQPCGSQGIPDGGLYQDEESYGDNPWGDHPERKCFPEREWCEPDA